MNVRTIVASVYLVSTPLQLALAGANGPADLQISDQQCDTLWKQAQGDKSGDLTADQAKPFLRDQAKVDKDGDGTITLAEWTNACHEGSVSMSSAAPPDQAVPPPTAAP
jgi:hypothetical protein